MIVDITHISCCCKHKWRCAAKHHYRDNKRAWIRRSQKVGFSHVQHNVAGMKATVSSSKERGSDAWLNQLLLCFIFSIHWSALKLKQCSKNNKTKQNKKKTNLQPRQVIQTPERVGTHDLNSVVLQVSTWAGTKGQAVNMKWANLERLGCTHADHNTNTHTLNNSASQWEYIHQKRIDPTMTRQRLTPGWVKKIITWQFKRTGIICPVKYSNYCDDSSCKSLSNQAANLQSSEERPRVTQSNSSWQRNRSISPAPAAAPARH